MSDLTDWIKTDLYPTLFENMDKILPELNLQRASAGNKWMSSLNRNGSTPKKKRTDKTVITNKAPGVITENGDGGSISIIEHIKERDRVEFIPALKTIADIVGLKIPSSKEFNSEEYKKYKDRLTLLEDVNSYFIYCLDKATGSDKVRDYLKDRGYSPEDVKAMELGFIPSQEQVNKYLIGKGYSSELIAEVLKLNVAIGDTHKLTIPFRSGGSLKGFVVRTLDKEQTNKYINSTGLVRSETFFNLKPIKGDKDLLIVEGYLDALISEAKGIDNVVALGGVNISEAQIKNAISKGARSFTLCLDKDKAGVEATNKAIDSILSEGVNKVYIVTLPEIKETKTDPDQLIKEKGVEYFKELIAEALPYYKYKLQNILSKYAKIEEINGSFTERDIDNLLDEVVVTGASIKDVVDRERYKKLFTELPQVKYLGVTEESLSIASDKIIISKDREIQAREFNSLLSEATKLKESGEIDKALELLNKKVKDVKLRDKATEFSYLLSTTSEEEIKNKLSNKPDSLNTSYVIGGEDLLLPAGAISIFTAPTSHGKTTFLINLALKVTANYKDKEVYFFSYEEDKESILIKTLNTYVDEDIAPNNRRTLKNYYATGSTEYFKAGRLDYFNTNKEKFFKELINTRRLNINYSSYNSDELIEAIRYLHKNTKVGAIFIDYIQLLNLPEGKYKTYSRQEEIKEICISLKDIAVETGLPIILGAQFNRTVTNALHLHPTKIGEAGDIERIASLMVGFWNNNFTTIATAEETKEINKTNINVPNTLYTTILKNREGSVGLNELLEFNGNIGSIKNTINTGKKYL